jgi:hypothetical protein
VVCFVSDSSVIEQLEPYPAEVDAIFTHPLRGILDGKVEGEDVAGLSAKGGEWWPFEAEFHVCPNYHPQKTLTVVYRR